MILNAPLKGDVIAQLEIVSE